jgi:hypothetical protein
MVLDASGNPYVAWSEFSGQTVQTYVRHWLGPSWQDLGSITHASGGLAITLWNNVPVIAVGGQGDILVQQWVNNAWQQIGSGFTSASASAGYSLTVDDPGASGVPLLGWAHSGPWQVVVSRYSQGIWSSVGTVDSSVPFLASPSVAVDASKNVFIAWDQPMSTANTYSPLVHEVSTPMDLGSPAMAQVNHGLSRPSLVIGAGGPAVAWVRVPTVGGAVAGIEVDQFSGGRWAQLGGVIPGGLGSRPHQLIATSTTLAIAGTGAAGSTHAGVSEWDANAGSWRLVCALSDPRSPGQLSTGVTGVALGQSGPDYIVAAVNSATGDIFVERVR